MMNGQTTERQAIRRALKDGHADDTDRDIIERAAKYLIGGEEHNREDVARLDRFARQQMGFSTSDYERDRRWRHQLHADA